MFNMMTPFDRRSNDLFHYFDDFGRDFFSGKDNGFAPCRTDILDLGDRYQLHADMPGFKKEENPYRSGRRLPDHLRGAQRGGYTAGRQQLCAP